MCYVSAAGGAGSKQVGAKGVGMGGDSEPEAKRRAVAVAVPPSGDATVAAPWVQQHLASQIYRVSRASVWARTSARIVLHLVIVDVVALLDFFLAGAAEEALVVNVWPGVTTCHHSQLVASLLSSSVMER